MTDTNKVIYLKEHKKSNICSKCGKPKTVELHAIDLVHGDKVPITVLLCETCDKED